MIDKEKLRIGLEEVSDYFFKMCRKETDEYKAAKAKEYCDVAEDALSLLKENKPQSVISDRQHEKEPGYWERKGFCPKCYKVVFWMANREYCGFCGQAVKWDE